MGHNFGGGSDKIGRVIKMCYKRRDVVRMKIKLLDYEMLD
jgi:hypothetical protein